MAARVMGPAPSLRLLLLLLLVLALSLLAIPAGARLVHYASGSGYQTFLRPRARSLNNQFSCACPTSNTSCSFTTIGISSTPLASAKFPISLQNRAYKNCSDFCVAQKATFFEFNPVTVPARLVPRFPDAGPNCWCFAACNSTSTCSAVGTKLTLPFFGTITLPYVWGSVGCNITFT